MRTLPKAVCPISNVARNSFDACFGTPEQRSRWTAELEAAAAQAPESAGARWQ
jgi:hypothetical protein